MKRILKAIVPIGDIVKFHMPSRAEILHVETQAPQFANSATFWYEEDELKPDTIVERTFYLIGTGMFVPSEHVYRGTVVFQEHSLVVHLFEVINRMDIA